MLPTCLFVFVLPLRPVPCCRLRLASILSARFERMYAQSPKTIDAPSTVLAKFDKQEAASKLSPLSAARVRALAAPSKASVADYDKNMTSVEQSVRKALASLEKATIQFKAAKEQQEAHAAKLKQLREKKLTSIAAAVQKAREAGRDNAEAEAAQEVSEEEEEEGDSGLDNMRLPREVQLLCMGVPLGEPTESCPAAVAFKIDLGSTSIQDQLKAFAGEDALADQSDWWKGNPAIGRQRRLTQYATSGLLNLPFMEDLVWGACQSGRRLGLPEIFESLVCVCVFVSGLLLLLTLRLQEPNATVNPLFPKVFTCGPEWVWTGFGDFLWARFVLCLSGSMFIAAVPMEHFRTVVQKGNWPVTKCADSLGSMTPEALVENGGFFHMLFAGDGMVIPPGHIIFKCCASHVSESLDLQGASREDGSVFLAPWP